MSTQKERQVRAAYLARKLREGMYKSQQEAADAFGISLKTLSTFELGKTWPQGKNQASIERGLDLAPGTLEYVVDEEAIDLDEMQPGDLLRMKGWKYEEGVARARDLTTDELLVELTRRVGELQEVADSVAALSRVGDNVVALSQPREVRPAPELPVTKPANSARNGFSDLSDNRAKTTPALRRVARKSQTSLGSQASEQRKGDIPRD